MDQVMMTVAVIHNRGLYLHVVNVEIIGIFFSVMPYGDVNRALPGESGKAGCILRISTCSYRRLTVGGIDLGERCSIKVIGIVACGSVDLKILLVTGGGAIIVAADPCGELRVGNPDEAERGRNRPVILYSISVVRIGLKEARSAVRIIARGLPSPLTGRVVAGLKEAPARIAGRRFKVPTGYGAVAERSFFRVGIMADGADVGGNAVFGHVGEDAVFALRNVAAAALTDMLALVVGIGSPLAPIVTEGGNRLSLGNVAAAALMDLLTGSCAVGIGGNFPLAPVVAEGGDDQTGRAHGLSACIVKEVHSADGADIMCNGTCLGAGRRNLVNGLRGVVISAGGIHEAEADHVARISYCTGG